MQLRIVGNQHYLCRYQEFAPDRLPKQALCFWDTYDLGDGCDYAVCATHEGDLVGFFRFVLHNHPAMLFAAGTWVHPNLRKLGIGKKMWAKALRWAERKCRRKVGINVTTKTRAGGALVDAVHRDLRHLYVTNMHDQAAE